MPSIALSTLLHLTTPVVLASASPRRKKLLEQIGLDFAVIPAAVDEDHVSTALPPPDYVQTLALRKAQNVAAMLDYSALVLGADTTVVLNGRIFNKPNSDHEARTMLRELSGNTHTVFTGLALVATPSDRVYSTLCATEVTFRELSDDEISAYIATGAPMDKAGSYGIQDDFGAVFVRQIHGCYYNVVGLPLETLYQALKTFAHQQDAA
jgi:septum formation protein